MRKVLIVSYHFPPVNNINARRFGEMAPYMNEFGWDPIILTTNSEGTLPVRISESNIVRIGENYYKEGIVAEVGDKGIPAMLKIPYFFLRRFKIDIRSIDRFIFEWGREIKKNTTILKEKNPDVIVGSCYPPAALWVGRLLSKKIKKPWIADLQDPLSLWNESRNPLAEFLDRQIDKMLIMTAKGVITISAHLGLKMKTLYRGLPIDIIYNGFNIEEEKIIDNNVKAKSETKMLYYAGRFHFHRMSAVKLLLDFLANHRDEPFLFKIRSLGPALFNEEILKYARKKGILGKIDLLPPADPETILREEGEADALILFEDLDKIMRNSEGTLPGKLMEYLPFKSPIITINRSDSEIGEILEETSRGYLVSNIKQLNKAMEDIIKRQLPFDWEKVSKYSRRSQCKAFCAFLDRIYESEK